MLPTVLRVYLISDTQPVRRARTETSFSTGDYQTNTYRIRYLNRWRSGLGVGPRRQLVRDRTAPRPRGQGVATSTLWAEGLVGAVHADRRGVGVRPLLPEPRRCWTPTRVSCSPAGACGAGRVPAGLRRDAGTTAWGCGSTRLLGSSSLRRQRQRRPAGDRAGGGHHGLPRGVVVRRSDARGCGTPASRSSCRCAAPPTPFRGAVARAPTPLRRSLLGGPLVAGGRRGGGAPAAAVAGRCTAPCGCATPWRCPAILTDTAQRVTDWSAGVGLGLRAGWTSMSGVAGHGAYAAPAYGTFAGVVPAGTAHRGADADARSWRSGRPRTSPSSGWYRHPLGAIGRRRYEPPHHTRAAATFRSRFLPSFRRGALDVLVQVGVEAWSDGVMGADSRRHGRSPLDGHGTVDWLVELRLLSAVLFWTLRNSQVERYEVVPGALMARAQPAVRRALGVHELGPAGYASRFSANGSPMPRSMTGFGAADGAVAGGRLRLEIRTVNHRHLNVQVKVPVGAWRSWSPRSGSGCGRTWRAGT